MGKNILYIVNGLGPGGAEKLVVDMANHFSLSNNVTIVSLTSDTFRETDLMKPVILDVFDLKENRLNIFGILKLVLMNKFDIIHAHMPISIILSRIIGLVFAFRRDLKLIDSFHNTVNEGENFKSKLLFRLIRATKKLPALTTNVSIESTEQLKNLELTDVNKTICLSNGVDFSAIRKKLDSKKSYFETEGFKICSVSSLTKQKGLDLGIESVIKLHQRGVAVEYIIVGEGEQRKFLSEIIRKNDAQSYIKLIGKSKDVPNIINQSDVFFLPSRWEGFGLVILEAVALKKKILATKTQGPIEILGHNYPYLCDSNIKDLVDKLSLIRLDEDMFYDSLDIESNYSISNMFRKIEAYYE